MQTIDTPALLTRNLPGTEDIRIQLLEPPHLHADGTYHQHDNTPLTRFYRVRLVD